uniref:Uncharacterized protein n=1 Tax=Salix viminalis TaxID=40686 RepID=A0A6N2KUN8_SALVM
MFFNPSSQLTDPFDSFIHSCLFYLGFYFGPSGNSGQIPAVPFQS